MLSLHSLFLQSFLKLGMGGTSPPAGAYCNQKKKNHVFQVYVSVSASAVPFKK